MLESDETLADSLTVGTAEIISYLCAMNTIYKFFLCLTVMISASLQLQAQGVPDTYCDDFRNWVRTIGSD